MNDCTLFQAADSLAASPNNKQEPQLLDAIWRTSGDTELAARWQMGRRIRRGHPAGSHRDGLMMLAVEGEAGLSTTVPAELLDVRTAVLG